MNRRRLRSGLGASYISLVPLTINTLLTRRMRRGVVVGVIAGGACIAAAAGVTVGAASVVGDFTFLTEP